jgi:hypothetical protein
MISSNAQRVRLGVYVTLGGIWPGEIEFARRLRAIGGLNS